MIFRRITKSFGFAGIHGGAGMRWRCGFVHREKWYNNGSLAVFAVCGFFLNKCECCAVMLMHVNAGIHYICRQNRRSQLHYNIHPSVSQIFARIMCPVEPFNFAVSVQVSSIARNPFLFVPRSAIRYTFCQNCKRRFSVCAATWCKLFMPVIYIHIIRESDYVGSSMQAEIDGMNEWWQGREVKEGRRRGWKYSKVKARPDYRPEKLTEFNLWSWWIRLMMMECKNGKRKMRWWNIKVHDRGIRLR